MQLCCVICNFYISQECVKLNIKHVSNMSPWKENLIVGGRCLHKRGTWVGKFSKLMSEGGLLFRTLEYSPSGPSFLTYWTPSVSPEKVIAVSHILRVRIFLSVCGERIDISLCSFSCVNHVYVSICSTYTFYFCLCPDLCATSYLTAESVKVLCVSQRNTIICLCTVLQHTNMVNSVFKCSRSKVT